MSGIERIAAERKRQIEVEGWTSQHDDGHDDGHEFGEMANTAARLTLAARDNALGRPDPTNHDAWGLIHKHGHNPVRMLEIAGALIAAEIDRLERLHNLNVSKGHGNPTD